MPVHYQEPTELASISGVRLGVAEAAIKKPGKRDLLVIALDEGTRVGGVFTQNAFAAAPVQLCRERLAGGSPIRALLVNSGNANAATGADGLQAARETTAAVAAALGVAADAVLPFSTGVIGQQLPVARMVGAAPAAVAEATPEGWLAAMRAIMTTDTVGKGASRTVQTSQGLVTITGIAKGVGMIHPNMATMLAFIGTDARLTPAATQALIADVASRTFNCVTVDGDTSTNDACVLCATAKVGATDVDARHADYAAIAAAVEAVCLELAHAIVRDGEGATKFIAVEVGGARNASEARAVALSIAHSPLVKTAMFASDANWGRLAMAIGKAGVEELDVAGVAIALDDVKVIEAGQPHPDYHEAKGTAVVSRDEFSIRVGLGRGAARTTVWTCDFSYDYVKINAEYRT